MNGLKRLVLCSVLASVPTWSLAQGSSGQGKGPGMMNQETMQQMHQNMSQMQEMMQGVPKAGSQAERQRLLQRHMKSMQEHMRMMREDMMGGGQGMMGQGQGMMGQGQNQGMMSNRQGGNRSDTDDSARPGMAMDYDQRLQMMGTRMDQMQLMMEQMLEHQIRSQEYQE